MTIMCLDTYHNTPPRATKVTLTVKALMHACRFMYFLFETVKWGNEEQIFFHLKMRVRGQERATVNQTLRLKLTAAENPETTSWLSGDVMHFHERQSLTSESNHLCKLEKYGLRGKMGSEADRDDFMTAGTRSVVNEALVEKRVLVVKILRGIYTLFRLWQTARCLHFQTARHAQICEWYQDLPTENHTSHFPSFWVILK